MSVQFILGNSGGGKTHYIYHHIIEEAQKHPNHKYLVIVPEQFTMSTQKQLVALHPGHSIYNIDILSFGRLSYRVLEELGGGEGIILEDVGKNFLLRKIVNAHKEELKSLKGNLKKMGYIDEIKSFLSELMQYRVRPEDLLEYRERISGENLKLKLDDIYLIYTEFIKEVDGSFITAEGRMELVQTKIKDSSWLKGATIVFDGFTGFTPIQNDLLEELMKVAEKIYITATIEKDDYSYVAGPMQELFYMSRKFLETTLLLASRTNTNVEESIWCIEGKEHRFTQAPALYDLEQNLFRRKKFVSPDATDAIRIYNINDPKAEIAFAADTMRQLVKTGKYRFSDFAVVSGDAEGYGNYVPQIFAHYDIPFFLDTTSSLVFHPFVECVTSMVEIASSDFSYSTIMGFLKTGLYGIARENIEKLENYLLAMGITHRYQWEKKWIRNPLHYTEEDMQMLNALRERLYGDFSLLSDAFPGSIASITKAIYQLLLSMEVVDRLEELADHFEEEGDYVRAEENRRIYRLVLQAFEKLIALLGEEEVDAREYAELLQAGFRGIQVAGLPHGNDCVLVGDIERTRLDGIKILFFLGVNDGVIPQVGKGGGILSEMERSELLNANAGIAFGARERALVQRFYLYLNMTKPTERLILTYARKNSKQDAIEPSFLIRIIRNMFPKAKYTFLESEEHKTSPSHETAYSSFSWFSNMARELARDAEGQNPSDWVELLAWYRKDPLWQEKAEEILRAAFLSEGETSMGAEAAKKLYGNELYNSISRLEKFESCAFSHFLNHGLRLKERKEHEVQSIDIGNILHDAMDDYARIVMEQNLRFREVTEAQMEDFCTEAIKNAIEKNGDSVVFDDERSKFLSYRIGRTFRRSVRTVTYQMQAGGYELYLHEAPFHQDVALPEGQMTLNGKIDRIDVANAVDNSFASVRIVDYKSSGRGLDLQQFYYGLSMQLVMYLQAAMEKLKEARPAQEILPGGVLYYGMTNPYLQYKNFSDKNKEALQDEDADKRRSALEELIRKQLKMDGYVNRDERVVNQMHRDFTGYSDVVPLNKNQDGSFGPKGNHVLSTEEFQLLMDYAKEKAVEVGSEMLDGNVSVNPYEIDTNRTSCSFCPYGAICAFDPSLPGKEYRTMDSMSDEEVLLQIRTELLGEEEEVDG